MSPDEIIQDIRIALRALRKNPGLTAIVAGTLGIGIAAITSIFSFLNPYLLRPLPYGDADRLVHLGQIDPVSGWDQARFSLPQYRDLRERSRSFSELGVYYYTSSNVTGDEGPERITTGILTANMFDLLDTEPLFGRTFLPGEDGPGGADVVLLDHGLWQRRYGGERAVLGQTVTLDGRAHTVIGVMPPQFSFPFNEVKLWIPLREDPARAPRERNSYLVVGRLADGVTAEQARVEAEKIQRELAEVHPDADGRFAGVTVKPLRAALNFAYDILRISFAVLLLAVGFLLLIACVNVASLMLARASDRRREIAVRAALGAGGGRLVRQLMTESFLLALLGGGLGITLSFSVTALLGPLLPESLFRVGEVSIDGRVLAFTAAVTLATPFLFGLVPALGAARANLAAALKDGGHGAGVGRGSMRGRRVLVVVEVALAIVLIAGAGLMMRSFLEIQRVDLGFDASRLLTVEVTPPESDYPTPEAAGAWFDRAAAELEALPGVRAAAHVAPLPLNHESWTLQFALPERTPAAPEDWPAALHGRVSAEYFATLGIPIITGRAFETGDGPEAASVVIISRSLAQSQWPDESPIGRTLLVGDPREPLAATVVGVAGDVKHTGLDAESRHQVYRPLTQRPARRRFLVLAVDGAPAALTEPVRRTLHGIDSNLPLAIRPMGEIVAENTLQWSLSSGFLAIFGSVALGLAALGLYGLISYSVARRQREMGIRVALGATRGQIRRLVVGEGLRLTGLGLGVGAVAALGMARVMASLLYGVNPFDPLTFGGVLVVFAAVAIGASVLPARRAERVDLRGVLRYE